MYPPTATATATKGKNPKPPGVTRNEESSLGREVPRGSHHLVSREKELSFRTSVHSGGRWPRGPEHAVRDKSSLSLSSYSFPRLVLWIYPTTATTTLGDRLSCSTREISRSCQLRARHGGGQNRRWPGVTRRRNGAAAPRGRFDRTVTTRGRLAPWEGNSHVLFRRIFSFFFFHKFFEELFVLNSTARNLLKNDRN